jgi:alkanesulfonate monooxygenase SsuD/methylene tetrahydromethanopterin reductase-like flavin-dependent oxidoreductase (luciferase family)
MKGRTWKGEPIREFVGEDTYARLALGLGAVQIVGDYDTVAARLRDLAASGHQGAVLSFFDPWRGLHELEDEIIPRLRMVGLRS